MNISNDLEGMTLALEWAAKGLYTTSPNPHIGCVIARDGQVIGAGVTQQAGGDHAEIQALKDAQARGHDVRGATAYVTLEPCNHFGRTPPCSDALVRAGLGRVVAAMEDPNPLVAGQGLAKLRAAGVAGDLDYITRQKGMFSYSGLSQDQMQRLRSEFGVYGLDSGRIRVAALNDGNIDGVAAALAQVMASPVAA